MMEEKLFEIEKCKKDVGKKPYWMSADQYDECPCVELKGHDGACKCSNYPEHPDSEDNN